jgi:hypothetical protein
MSKASNINIVTFKAIDGTYKARVSYYFDGRFHQMGVFELNDIHKQPDELVNMFNEEIIKIENPRKKTIGFKPYGSYLCHVSGEVITNEGQRRQIMKKHGLQDKPECPAAIKNRETERFDRMMYERNRYAN